MPVQRRAVLDRFGIAHGDSAPLGGIVIRRMKQRNCTRSERVLGFGLFCIALAGVVARAQTVAQTQQVELLNLFGKRPRACSALSVPLAMVRTLRVAGPRRQP
jgi:hypothetical protein